MTRRKPNAHFVTAAMASPAGQAWNPHFVKKAFRRLGVGLASLLAASTSSANVIEVSHEGAIAVRSGGGAAVWERLDEDNQVATNVVSGSWVRAAAQVISTTNAVPVGVPERFAALNAMAAARANVSPTLLAALIWQESRWNPLAVSSRGAIGLAQLMPATARDLGVDPRDPVANLTGGARYLRQLLDGFGGNVEMALAAYNAGIGRVRKVNGIPAIRETQSYVRSIVQRVASLAAGVN
jgi:soluble lytic murein transglycosylase-like protein